LARKYERHEEYLRIQIEDARNFGEALGYLRKLGAEAVSSIPFVNCIEGDSLLMMFVQAESNLARYGRAMLESAGGDDSIAY
jgi:vacuolar protein sorting-associated protein 11